MINLINGSLLDPQENITWAKNKSSATVILNTHSWREGEVLIVGYKIKGEGKEIMIGVGIKKGIGPSCYRAIIDRSVIIVAEVLDQTPDVSYFAFDQRYLVNDGEKLLLTRRYIDRVSDEVRVENIKVEERCVIIENSTGDIWICDPPSLINFFDLTTKAAIDSITDLGDGQIMVNITENGKTWENQCFVGVEEKSYLTEMVFARNFEVSVSSQKYNSAGSQVSSNDPCIVTRAVFTLTSKYAGKLTDLDEIPTGWEKVNSGTYIKTVEGNTTSSSGSVLCKLTIGGYTGSKTAGSVSAVVDKYVFIVYSPDPITSVDGADKTFLTSSASLGSVTVTPPQDCYVWLAFPVNMKPSQITQLGVGYVSQTTETLQGVRKSGVNLGNYIVYRSLNPGNGQSQEITVR